MKKLVITTAMSLGLLASSYAQGFFNFDNSDNYTGDTSANGIVTIGALGAAGEGAVGAALGSGTAPNYDVGYLWLLGTAQVGNSLTPNAFLTAGAQVGNQTTSGSVYGPMSPFAGSFYGPAPTGDATDGSGLYGDGTISPATTGLPDATMITLQVVAWYDPTGTTTFLQAEADGYNVGGSSLVAIRLAAGLDVTVAKLDNVSSFTVQAVPEPSTLALAGLGGLSLLLMRRRK